MVPQIWDFPDIVMTASPDPHSLARIAGTIVLAGAGKMGGAMLTGWLARGLDVGQLQTLTDFQSWPVIDRDVVRDNRLRMRSQQPGVRLIAKATGGSSGVPLHFDLDPDSNDRRYGAWHRGYAWAKAAPGTKQLYLWGVGLGKISRLRRCKDYLYNRLYGRLVLNSFDLREERIPEFLRRLNRYRPDVIVAYTNPLYTFARSLEERGLRPFSPKSLIVGAEKLHDFQRAVIERVFAAPVFETYGSREFMLIGAECDRHQGLHLTMENLLVEILDENGMPTPDGEEGNVVVTDLTNHGMPFVRYQTGDRAMAGWSTCSCGRGLPIMRKVVGRQLDMLQTVDGRRVPGEFFPHLLKDFPAIARFQVIQEEPERIQLCLVLRNKLTKAEHSSLESEIRHVIGPATEFDLRVVDDIPLTPAGKLQVVVNRCAGVKHSLTTPRELQTGRR